MATPLTLPAIESLPSQPVETRAEILDLLFEHSTQLHTLAVSSLAEKPFQNYSALIQHVRSQLYELLRSDLESDQRWLITILGAHPRLGAQKVDSALSRMEQGQLQHTATQQATDEAKRLRQLNEDYEKKFPGLIYVVFVNGRSRPVIMQDMQNRIANSTLAQEKEEAIEAMCMIALDRARKLGGVEQGVIPLGGLESPLQPV